MKVAYVVGTFPSLSETFILREILALQGRGVQSEVFALRRPDAGPMHAQAVALQSHAHYPRSVFSPGAPWLCTRLLGQIGLRPLLRAADFARQAQSLGIAHVHAHFAYVTADVAHGMAALLGVNHSVSAHAWDIYTQPVMALRRRIGAASFVAVCTEHGREFLRRACPELPDDRLVTIRHGLFPAEFTGGDATGNLVLAVGRLEPKKGFGYLVDACSLLKARGIAFQCAIVGEGSERAVLEARIARAGLSGCVRLDGARCADAVAQSYRRAAVFVAPSVVAAAGDRDGLPNVVLEAMASGLPVVATDGSAAGEAVVDGAQGFVVPAGDAGALADRIADLLAQPELRKRMGASGQRRVAEEYDVTKNVEPLARLFLQYGTAAPADSG